MVEAALLHAREAHEAKLAEEAGDIPPPQLPPSTPPPSMRSPDGTPGTLERARVAQRHHPFHAGEGLPSGGAAMAADMMRQRAWLALRRLRMPQQSL